MKTITIVGAGLAGSLVSIYLARRGYEVKVYEQRPDPRKFSDERGRSINMALSRRGIYALEQVGLLDRVITNTIPLKGRLIHSRAGEESFQPYGRDVSEVLYSISRKTLNAVLLDEAEQIGNVEFHFQEQCTMLDLDKLLLHLRNQNSGRLSVVCAEVILGADGSRSIIREALRSAGRIQYSEIQAEYGYKELTIPASPSGSFLIEKNALHIWPRSTYMFIALPNPYGSFTGTLFLPFEGEYSFSTLVQKEHVLAFFRSQFPDVASLMPDLTQEYFINPTGYMADVRCATWHWENKVLLLGDAAHAILPFIGQGMNCGFEDCTYLEQCIATWGDDWDRVFSEFEAIRKVNTDAISEVAFENFIEMRDLVATPEFFLKKKVECILENRYPEHFVPKYSMISFRRIPYATALKRGRLQEAILIELCQGIVRPEDVDLKKADALIESRLSRLPAADG